LHSANDSELILRRIRQGAAEFLFPPFSTEQFRQGWSDQARAGRDGSGAIGRDLLPDARQVRVGTMTLACDLAFRLRALNFRKVLLVIWILSREPLRFF